MNTVEPLPGSGRPPLIPAALGPSAAQADTGAELDDGASSMAMERRRRVQLLVRLHLLSRSLRRRGLFGLSRCVDSLIRVGFAARIPGEADIHPSVHFSHNGLAVVVTKEARIGQRCQIGMHVVLGSNWPQPGGPILEDDVIVHTGAKVLGPVRIGTGSVIGANAVVLKDIPPRCLAVGVPAVVKRTGIDIARYRVDLTE